MSWIKAFDSEGSNGVSVNGKLETKNVILLAKMLKVLLSILFLRSKPNWMSTIKKIPI